MPPLAYYLEQLETAAGGGDGSTSNPPKPDGGNDGENERNDGKTTDSNEETARRALDLGRQVVYAWATAAVFVCEQCCTPMVSSQTSFAREVVRVAYE